MQTGRAKKRPQHEQHVLTSTVTDRSSSQLSALITQSAAMIDCTADISPNGRSYFYLQLQCTDMRSGDTYVLCVTVYGLPSAANYQLTALFSLWALFSMTRADWH